jgi:hypothetical protein
VVINSVIEHPSSISCISMISHDGGSPDALSRTIPVIITSRDGLTPVSLPDLNQAQAFNLNFKGAHRIYRGQ